MRRLVAVAALLLAALPASASLLESTTADLLEGTPVGHLHYQADAGTEFDAPDSCDAVLASELPFDLPVGSSLDGLLVPVDDEIDHYRLPIGQELVGDRVTLSVFGREATLPIAIEAFMPACGTSVTAEENQPVAEPHHPEPADGEVQVAPSNGLKDGSPEACGGDDWGFVLNQFHDLTPPASLHGIWTDGTTAEIPMRKATDATTVFYSTDYNTGIRLQSVVANVPAEWDGRFNSIHGPCGAVDGGAVYGDPSVATQTSISFTPIEAGTYVLAVRSVPPEAPEVPTSVPLSCHFACAGLPKGAMDLSGYTALAS